MSYAKAISKDIYSQVTSFYFYLPFLTLVAFAAQFVFGYISFDKIQMSKTKMIMLFIFFCSLAILSFSKIKL